MKITHSKCVGSQPTDSYNFVSRFLINPDNSISPPNGGLVIIIRICNQMASWYPVAAYLHTGGGLNRRSGGGPTFKLYLIF